MIKNLIFYFKTFWGKIVSYPSKYIIQALWIYLSLLKIFKNKSTLLFYFNYSLLVSYQSVVDFYKYWILNQSYHLAVYVYVLWLVNFCWTISEKLHCRIYTNQNSCLFKKRGICTYQVIGSIMICVTSVPLPETKQMWNVHWIMTSHTSKTFALNSL